MTNKSKQFVEATGKYYPFGADKEKESAELEIVTGDFKGIKFIFGEMKFADEENSDGSINMQFDRYITEGEVPPEKELDFNMFVGDVILVLLEEYLESERKA